MTACIEYKPELCIQIGVLESAKARMFFDVFYSMKSHNEVTEYTVYSRENRVRDFEDCHSLDSKLERADGVMVHGRCVATLVF